MMNRRLALAGLAVALVLLTNSRGQAEPACFTASKQYRIHPTPGGRDLQDGWTVRGGAFNLCVRREEMAEKSLHRRYPESGYRLTPVSTIGCHQC
jgi:hypothetical protein